MKLKSEKEKRIIGKNADNMIRFPINLIFEFVKQALLEANVNIEVAELTAKGLWTTSLRGVDSHGIRLLPHYLEGVFGGRINPNPQIKFKQTSASTGVLDADHTFGHAAGIIAIRKAMELAEQAGVGFVAVKNSSHCGAMAYYGLEACNKDMIGLAFTHATSKVKTAGATQAFFGTNPLCFTAPMRDEGPFCFDSAPTRITSNRINQFREENEPLPPGCAADRNGQETLNPYLAEQLIPIGDYKGYGWAMMVDILCGLLTGMAVGKSISKMFIDPMSQKRRLGQFYGAIRISAFEDPDRFKQRLQNLANQVRSQKRMNHDIPVQIPGDPEKRNEEDRQANGIPVNPLVLKQLNDLAESLGMSPLVTVR